MSEQEQRDAWLALGARTDIPHPARVYNYLLGGTDHFPADREAAEMSLRLTPEMRDSALANRAFLARAVGTLRDLGVRQFLDVGCGLPASPNTHEVGRAGGLHARVCYVDVDPVATARARALLAEDPATAVVEADLREVGTVLHAAGKVLDFGQPVGLLFVACLHNIADADDPAGIVGRYLTALAPGSYLVISHVTDEFAPDRMHATTEQYAQRGATFIGRSKAAIGAMFNDRHLLDPGVARISYWRPEGGVPAPNADQVWGFAGVARVLPACLRATGG
jgi:SAM-dependent methyltransferase